jgi:hypothetical protein
MITGWLSGEDCPDCGGPLLDTSTTDRLLTLECPGCGYRAAWRTTWRAPAPDVPAVDDRPARPGEAEDS